MTLKQIFTGVVKKVPYAVGSKSEHEAIVLDNGQEQLKLQIKGGSPFRDPSFEPFVGQNVKVEGTLYNNRILIDKASDIKVSVPKPKF